jgi:two-component system, OmpR family, alkaline phosphatase synthesis response regulator PhoP
VKRNLISPRKLDCGKIEHIRGSQNKEFWTLITLMNIDFLMNELILVVEDEPKIMKLARDYLERGGFRVVTAVEGTTALTIARQEKPGMVVLDLNLPGMDGLDVCRALRRESDVPIIMLTARSEETDRLIGLELGADDYISKPFSPRELVARVRAVLRRVKGGVHQPGMVHAGELEIDLNGHRVYLNGESIQLSRMEFNLLAVLAQHPGQTFSRAQLLSRLHGVAYDGYDRSVDAHVKNLRRKLEPDPSEPRYVQTVYGIGYRFTDDM